MRKTFYCLSAIMVPIFLSQIYLLYLTKFTGNTGSYLSRSTGMGLYLVRKMANDLSIDVEIKNNSYGGVTIILFFLKLKIL